MRRCVDLLGARPEVDGTRLGFIGSSDGALTGGILPGVEKRIKKSILEKREGPEAK